ncbi:MAG: hypothetical protein KKB50_02670 [Planctomycetes bacterium]|nr:hypothetical protein [Planctomycetota bacterium]
MNIRPGILLALLVFAGCAQQSLDVARAFPHAGAASPWILQNDVWRGTFAAAASALAEDAAAWQECAPTHVWLAVYEHDAKPGRRLTARAFAFQTAEDARRAFAHFQPLEAQEFAIADGGCWTEVGVLFVWGRLVFDIFGDEATSANQWQAAYLAGFIERQMPRGAPDWPQ